MTSDPRPSSLSPNPTQTDVERGWPLLGFKQTYYIHILKYLNPVLREGKEIIWSSKQPEDSSSKQRDCFRSLDRVVAPFGQETCT